MTVRVLHDDDSIADLVADYIEAVKEGRHTTGRRAQRKPRAATVAMYKAVMDVFLKWAGSVKLSDPAALDEKAIDRFTRHLETRPGKNGKPLTSTTIQSYARDVSTFLRWAHKRGSVVGDVRMVVAKPESKRLRPENLLTQSEVALLITSAAKLRDKVLIRMLAQTGCRLGELLSLRVGDVHREDGICYVLFPNGKTGARTAGVERDLYRMLGDYVKTRPGGTDEETPVFLSERKARKGGYLPITDSGVQQMLSKLADDCEIKKPVYAHGFRHLFATEYMRGDDKPGGVRGDPVTLAKILGHRGLTMINATYAKFSDRDIQRATLDHLERMKRRA
jgi:integrase